MNRRNWFWCVFLAKRSSLTRCSDPFRLFFFPSVAGHVMWSWMQHIPERQWSSCLTSAFELYLCVCVCSRWVVRCSLTRLNVTEPDSASDSCVGSEQKAAFFSEHVPCPLPLHSVTSVAPGGGEAFQLSQCRSAEDPLEARRLMHLFISLS